MRTLLIPVVSAVLVLSLGQPSFAQEWVEFTSQEERLFFVFPGPPEVTETTWVSQFGAILPARVYRVTRGQSRYSATVVDYNPIERLLVERSRSCPPGANTCQGIPDWGIGYWKTDMRGALVYALSKFLERDARAHVRVDLHAREPARHHGGDRAPRRHPAGGL
jgi:hypothetical protein